MEDVRTNVLEMLKESEISETSFILSEIKETASNDIMVLSVWYSQRDGEPDANTVMDFLTGLKLYIDEVKNVFIDVAIGNNHVFASFCN